MTTFILTYNPKMWPWPEADKSDIMRRTAQGERVEDRWSTGRRSGGIDVGDRWWLFQQGDSGRGLLASGQFIGGCYQDTHWSGDGSITNYADIEFEVLLPSDDRLPIEVVSAATSHVDWQHMQGSGVSVPEDDAAALHALWNAHLGLEGGPAGPGPLSDEDCRLRAWAEVRRRQGQPAFRGALIEAYLGACAITDCRQLDALQAAHIRPYRGPQSNRVDNGLLLRADVHTLFDLGYLSVTDDYRLIVSPLVQEPTYRGLDGHALRLPADPALKPSRELLAEHRATLRT